MNGLGFDEWYLCYWAALLGADRDWPVIYSSWIDGVLLPFFGRGDI